MSTDQPPGPPPSGATPAPAPSHDSTLGAFSQYTPQHRRKSKRRRSVKLPGSDITELNLTAMMDMMTILLVFLIRSYATEPDKIVVSNTLRPPTSQIETMMTPAVTLTITADQVLVEDKVVMRMSDVTSRPTNQIEIPALLDALNRKSDHLKKVEELGGAPFDGKILIVAHRAIHYDVITAVLYTAGKAHFSRYRLVVMEDGSAKQK